MAVTISIRHADGRVTVVPVHASETIGPGLFCKILRDTEMQSDQFAKTRRTS